jgi:AraC-like DNA-binding protein
MDLASSSTPPPDVADSVTVISGYALAIAKALESRGVDPRGVFAAAGIHDGVSNDPLRRLPRAAIDQLYRTCVAVTGDDCFGLTVAKFIHAPTLHALGYGLLASTTLMDFCLRVQRFFPLVSQRALVDVVPDGSTVRFAFPLRVEVSPQTQDAWLGAMFLTMRMMHREEFHPVTVEFAHGKPAAGDAKHVEFFGAPVRFDAAIAALVLPRADMEVRLHGACPELAQWHDNLAAKYIAKLDRTDVVANVRARILELLPSGACSKGKIARDLAMSATTLQQRLTERGTSFHALLNHTRQELATGYLQRSGTSITEIAFVLGFTDVSNFTRAFKRWTGTSPTGFRARERVLA